MLAEVHPGEPERLAIGSSHPRPIDVTRFGVPCFELNGRSLSLELYWLEGYGGGLFLPFADMTSGDETYGGGRYLLDTVKGADLGLEDGQLVLDFNSPTPVLRVRPQVAVPACTGTESAPRLRPRRGAAAIGRLGEEGFSRLRGVRKEPLPRVPGRRRSHRPRKRSRDVAAPRRCTRRRTFRACGHTRLPSPSPRRET